MSKQKFSKIYLIRLVQLEEESVLIGEAIGSEKQVEKIYSKIMWEKKKQMENFFGKILYRNRDLIKNIELTEKKQEIRGLFRYFKEL